MNKVLVDVGEFYHTSHRLAQFYSEVRKSRISYDALYPCFNEVLSDLDGAEMCDYTNDLHNPAYYDPHALRIGQGAGYYSKPKIDIHASITSKGNLSICWAPRGYFTDEGHFEDFLYFNPEMLKRERPYNELMFIRGFENLLFTLREKEDPQSWLASHLLNACRAAVSMLYTRLDYRYHVRYVENLLLTISRNNHIVDAEITDVAKYVEQAARSAEENALQNFEELFGFSREDLITSIASVGTTTKTGKEIAPNSYPKYLMQDLRKHGRDTTVTKVTRALKLAKKSMPNLQIPYQVCEN